MSRNLPVFDQLKAIVERPDSPWLKAYKDDFYRHDKTTLQHHCAPGVRFLWVLREHGTELERIGVLPEKHSTVAAILRSISTCAVYLIEIVDPWLPARITQISREKAMRELAKTDYAVVDGMVLKHCRPLARLDAKVSPPSQERRFGSVEIRTCQGGPLSRADLLAISKLGARKVAEISGSLLIPVTSYLVDGRDLFEVAPPLAVAP